MTKPMGMVYTSTRTEQDMKVNGKTTSNTAKEPKLGPTTPNSSVTTSSAKSKAKVNQPYLTNFKGSYYYNDNSKYTGEWKDNNINGWV